MTVSGEMTLFVTVEKWTLIFKTQFHGNAKTQFEIPKTQFEDTKTQF